VNRFTVSLVGSGRVASALGNELNRAGCRIEIIVSKSESKGCSLAERFNATWSDKLIFPDSTEVVFVAVPDKNLKSVLGKIRCNTNTVVAHTAGSIGMDLFPETIVKKGVFYPLQTFSLNRRINFKNLPVFIEAADNESLKVLAGIAELLGSDIRYADTERRRMLHLAAVFVCNFTNHMLTTGQEIAVKAGYSLNDLKPLIEETILKAFEAGPEKSQTGPAVRNDKNTIRKHLDLLSFDPDLQRMYREISRSILKYHNRL